MDIFSFSEKENAHFYENIMAHAITEEQLDARIREKEAHDTVLVVLVIGITAFFLLLVFLVFSKRFSFKKLFNPLNAPIKRVGFLCLVIGVLLMFFGGLNRGFEDFDYNTFIRSISFERSRYDSEVTFGIGFYSAIIGLFLSFLYDWTVGPIVNWVKKGS
ncbi:hypothetical protein [Symbiopectobacterium purcellii]|uniref:hypothetical protein n=1 Tax=Symbiopectobacterium purcellii TaxID=2871826 RepID=UPI003F8522FD